MTAPWFDGLFARLSPARLSPARLPPADLSPARSCAALAGPLMGSLVYSVAGALTLGVPTAWAQSVQPMQMAQPSAADRQIPPQTLAQGLALVTDAAYAVAPRGARVQVEPGNLDPRLNLATCARAEAYLPAGLPAWGRVRLGLRCLDGQVRWNVFMPINVQVFAPALVLSTTLAAGAKLDETQLRRVEVDWSAAGGALFDDVKEVTGRTLARALQAGQPLQQAHLQVRQWFATGDTVRIVAAGSGFSITSEGQALTPGQEGKPARIQTESGRVVTGRAVGERRVEINL